MSSTLPNGDLRPTGAEGAEFVDAPAGRPLNADERSHVMDATSATGVIAAVQRDHREIETMLSRVASQSGSERRDAFEQLVRKLAVHETAEEEVVHPLAKDAGATDVVSEVLSEEGTAKQALAALDGADVNTPQFEQEFERLRKDVLAHAQHEEQQEHPRILQTVPAEKLAELEKRFELAERSAPTHPHPHGSESRAGNLVLGPILAVTDRVRDALRGTSKS